MSNLSKFASSQQCFSAFFSANEATIFGPGNLLNPGPKVLPMSIPALINAGIGDTHLAVRRRSEKGESTVKLWDLRIPKMDIIYNHVYVYIYICIYIYTYTYTHIHIDI